jgi:hypothetical protein
LEAAKTAEAASGNATKEAQKLVGESDKIEELKEKSIDRTITEEHRRQFIHLLENAPKGKIAVCRAVTSGGDTAEYAEKIREMLVSAGYDCGTMVAWGMGGDVPPNGIFVAVRSLTNQPPFSEPVLNAFIAIGIDATGVVDPKVGQKNSLSDGCDLMIFIGTKP